MAKGCKTRRSVTNLHVADVVCDIDVLWAVVLPFNLVFGVFFFFPHVAAQQQLVIVLNR